MTRKPKKTNKQRDNLTKTILQYMGGKRYEPLGVTDLLKRLSIPKELQPLCKQIIESLLKEGNPEADVPLENGDKVIVPQAGFQFL